MKFSVAQEDFDRGLSIVGQSVARRWTLQILGNVLLTVKDGGLSLTTTDLEMMVRCPVEADVEEDGAVTLPYTTLSRFVSALPNEIIEVTVDIDRWSAHLECSRFRATINGISANEYPEGFGFPDDVLLSWDSDVFGSMVSQVSYAAATEESRPVLQGVSVALKDGRMTFAAADGYRLAVKHFEVELEGEASFVVPAKAMRTMAGFAQKGSGPVEMSVSGGKAFFRQDVEMSAALLEYPFPDVNQIIPVMHDTSVRVSSTELLSALRLASVFSEDSPNSLVILEVGADKLAVSATSAERGQQRGEVGAEVKGELLRMGFNSKYLADALSAPDSDRVEMLMTTPTSPMVVRPVEGDDGVHVVMPTHLRD
jgi:DNA polymerase-3 subunit beta